MEAREIKKRLNAFSKEKIVDALASDWELKRIAERVLNKLEQQQVSDLIEEHGKAIDKQLDAMKKYNQWKKDMIKKYGADGEVKLKDVPMEEIKIGASLERKLNYASMREKTISEKLDNLLEVEEEVINDEI